MLWGQGFVIAAGIFERFRPESFLDASRRIGKYIDGLRKFGVDVHGIEFADAD